MSDQKNKKILITLSSIIDDRLGTLRLLDPKFVEEMDFKVYGNRTNDKFSSEHFTYEQYKRAWKNRDALNLMNGMPTQIWTIVVDRLSSYVAGEFSPATNGLLEIDVNVYPYVLSNEEREDLEGVLYFYFAKSAKINLINKPLEAITFDFLRYDYHTFICYELHDWLRTIPDTDLYSPIPGCMVYGPALEENPATTIAELEALDPNEREMYLRGGGFAEIESMYEPFVSLRFVEAGTFSFKA